MKNIILLLCLLYSFSAAAVGKDDDRFLEVTLPSESKVSAVSMNLGSIATIKGNDDSIIKSLSQLVIGKAPRVGLSVIVTKDYLKRHVERNLTESNLTINWVGADRVRIKTVGIEIKQQELISKAVTELRKHLSSDYESIEIDYRGINKALSVPAVPYDINVREIRSKDIKKRTCVWVDIVIDDKNYESIPVWLDVTIMKKAYIATNKIIMGNAVIPALLSYESADITLADGKPIFSRNDFFGMRAKMTILEGEIITTNDLEAIPLVQKYEDVTIVAEYKNVKIEVEGTAVQDGHYNEFIYVKRKNSKEKIKSKVIARNTVKVD